MAIYQDLDSTSQISYPCRVWIRLRQDNQTIYGSGGVSSIVDQGLGHTKINFTNQMPNSNYAIVGGANQSAAGSAVNFNFSLCIQNHDQLNMKVIYRPSATSDTKEDSSSVNLACFI